jgi:hypothetical protein
MDVVDQGEGAVLEFAGGIGLGVDVGDFLELEGALPGDGVLVAAAQEEGVMFVRELLGDEGHAGVQGQKVAGPAGQGAQGGGQLGLGGVDEAGVAAECRR